MSTPNTLLSINNLTLTCHALGWMNEAATPHEKVLEVCQGTLEDEHPNMLLSMKNLALTYHFLLILFRVNFKMQLNKLYSERPLMNIVGTVLLLAYWSNLTTVA